MRTLFQTIKQQFLEGNDLVLVSVTASSGSTPRGAGSRMLVGKNGRISGTIGGGAVEYRAECMALDILEKKESCEHEFRLNHKDVENIGMICGGDVTAFFQYLDHNDPIIMEITETAEKFYEERKEKLDADQNMVLFDPIDTWKKTKVLGGTYEVRELLVPVIREGKRVYESPSVMELREYCQKEQNTLWDESRRFVNPQKVYVDLSQKLWDLKKDLLEEMSEKALD